MPHAQTREQRVDRRACSRVESHGVSSVTSGPSLRGSIGPPPTDDRADRTGDDGDDAEVVIGASRSRASRPCRRRRASTPPTISNVPLARVALGEVLRRPVRERRDRAGVRAVAEHRAAEQRQLRERAERCRRCSPLASRSLRAGSAISRQRQREHDAGAAGDEERRAPAPARFDEAAEHVAERGADRNREVEDRERARLLIGRRDVVDDRRGERRVARLADADATRARSSSCRTSA